MSQEGTEERAPPGETLYDEDSPGHGPEHRLLSRNDAVGRYVVLNVLGTGGMGVVYAAYDPELDRKVAVKLLNPRKRKGEAAASAQSTGRDRLLREAQAMARLRHLNVITVHDVGEYEGQVFVAMELVEGQTLGAWLRAGLRPWQDVLPVMAAAGRGLVAAHAGGLVHRDFKPDNVMIDVDGRVVVMDFGLARAAGGGRRDDAGERAARDISRDSSSLDADLTTEGALIGTPRYMAPEQFLRLPSDARTDQFAFCITLYEALYGEPPFEGTTRDERAEATTAGKVRDAPRSSTVPKWLRRVVLQGLNPDPNARHVSMEALLGELVTDPGADRLRYIAGGTMVLLALGLVAALFLVPGDEDPCAAGETRMAEQWSDAHGLAVQSSFGATGLAYAESSARRVAKVMDDYAQAWTRAHRDACEATHVRNEQSFELLDRRMACLDDRLHRVGALVEVLSNADPRVVENAVEAARRLPAVEACADSKRLLSTDPMEDSDPEIRQSLVRARAHFEAGRYDEGQALAQAAVRESDGQGEDSPVRAEAYLMMGLFEDAAGRYENAEHALEQAFFSARRADHATLDAQSAIHLTRVVGLSRARPVEGLRWGRHAEAELAGVEDADGMHADLLRNLGQIHHAQGRDEKAITQLEAAIQLQEEALGPDHPDLAATLNALGDIRHGQGEYERAVTLVEHARLIWENALGPDHPKVAGAYNTLGNVRYAQGRFQDALVFYNRVLETRQKVLGRDHPAVARTLNNLGLVYEELEEWDAAADAHTRALAIKLDTLGPDHPSVAVSENNLGNLALAREQPDAALEHYERSHAIMLERHGADHLNVAFPLTGLGRAHLALGHAKQALTPLERAVEIRKDATVDPNFRAMSELALAQCLSALGVERERVRALAERARDAYAAAGPSKAKEQAEAEALLTRGSK